MKNKILKLINERDRKLNNLWDEEDKIHQEYLQKIEDLLPYNNKYIKIDREHEYTMYFKVSSITIDNKQISIGGIWFLGGKSPYMEENYLCFRGYYQTQYDIRNIEKLIDCIHVITKEEYLEAFKQKAKDIEDVINSLID
jgi:hypothetical protein